jgi:prephenate dehydrogenase
MAGSEKYGPKFATPDLYVGSTTLVEPLADVHDSRAYETICQLWHSLGSRAVPVEPALHDALLARTSHLPHILAACIARLAADRLTEDADMTKTLSAFTGGGFRDMTRVAAGRPEIWRDICLTNKAALLDSLHQLRGQLGDLVDMLSGDSGKALEEFFRAGQEARRKVLDE